MNEIIFDYYYYTIDFHNKIKLIILKLIILVIMIIVWRKFLINNDCLGKNKTHKKSQGILMNGKIMINITM